MTAKIWAIIMHFTPKFYERLYAYNTALTKVIPWETWMLLQSPQEKERHKIALWGEF